MRASVHASSPSRALVERDIDLLAPMAAKNLARVFVSITTLDRDARAQARAARGGAARRLQAVRGARRRGQSRSA